MWTISDKKNIYCDDFGIFRYLLNNYCQIYVLSNLETPFMILKKGDVRATLAVMAETFAGRLIKQLLGELRAFF